jgi:hypothetical protein
VEPGRGDIEHEPVCEVEVAVSALVVADSPRVSGESAEHVEALALAAAEGELPPIVVHRPTMRVIDGRHRVRAARLLGQEKIAVRFFHGDEAAAFVLAVRSNIAHGLPLSLSDRKHAAARIIASHPEWSDRMVASVTGIAAGTVAEIRQQAGEDTTLAKTRIGRDGRLRPVDGTHGRLVASELIDKNPGLSLRQIARAAGISPETARDVRNRLSRGEDPLPSGRRKNGRVDSRVDSRIDGRAEGGRAGTSAANATSGGLSHLVRRVEAAAGPELNAAFSQDWAGAVERLRADPALRFSETGRNLLRLLNVLTIRAEDWDKIIDNVPPHVSSLVAQLAKECAEIWSEFASRTESRKLTPA